MGLLGKGIAVVCSILDFDLVIYAIFIALHLYFIHQSEEPSINADYAIKATTQTINATSILLPGSLIGFLIGGNQNVPQAVLTHLAIAMIWFLGSLIVGIWNLSLLPTRVKGDDIISTDADDYGDNLLYWISFLGATQLFAVVFGSIRLLRAVGVIALGGKC